MGGTSPVEIGRGSRGSHFGVPIWGAHLGCPSGVPIWGADLGARCLSRLPPTHPRPPPGVGAACETCSFARLVDRMVFTGSREIQGDPAFRQSPNDATKSKKIFPLQKKYFYHVFFFSGKRRIPFRFPGFGKKRSIDRMRK